MLRFLMFFVAMYLSTAQIAIAQDVTPIECTTIVCQVMGNFPELNAWLLAIFTFLGVMLRAISDLLTFIGSQVKNKSASGWAEKFNSYALWAAQVVGWFGGGTSKAVLAKQVEKKIESQEAKNDGQGTTTS